MSDVFETDRRYVAGTYARFPLEIVSGKGALLQASDGRQYIDLCSGIAVNGFGTADEEWIRAVTAQLHAVQHTSNLFYNAPSAELARTLCLRTGMKKVFFCNSGAEANECAIKAARKYSAEKKGDGVFTVLTLKNSFHGRTLTALAATGQDAFHRLYTPLTPGFVYAGADDLDEVYRIAESTPLAGIMFEPVQGEGGVVPLKKEFIEGLAALSAEKDIPLIADEVQTGNGRSGTLFAYMQYGILPDIVTTAKGLGGGLPIGATMLGEKMTDVFGPGDNGSTFGGNPAICAGALNILSRIDDDLLAGVRERSRLVFETLSGAEGVIRVTGLGLMIGVETVRPAADVIASCRENGVLVLKAKNKVRLLPPLNIKKELLVQALSVLCEACKEKKEKENE